LGQDPPVNFGPIQNVIWKVSLPEGHSSPCIWGDNIFITGFNEEGKKLLMFCLNRKDGAIKWEKNLSVKEFEPANPLNNPDNHQFLVINCYSFLYQDNN
jgi:outer membrane protein assembly factor BamB